MHVFDASAGYGPSWVLWSFGGLKTWAFWEFFALILGYEGDDWVGKDVCVCAC